jgi:CheY-like chemotaxis protein
MPRMDGLEAARILRRELPESKVIIISQSDPALVRLQAEQVGAAAFVVKGGCISRLAPRGF